MPLTDTTALVTGGGRGIGRAVAEGLAAAGAAVVVNYLADEAAASRTVAGIRGSGGRAWAVQADVAEPAQVEALFAEARSLLGDRLDILVNNAGGPGTRRTVGEMSLEEWRRCLAVNLDGVFLCTRAALPLLADGRGRIVNVTSISARTGGPPGAGHYAAAKGGVSNFTRTCAKELAPRGITVNGVAPRRDRHRPAPAGHVSGGAGGGDRPGPPRASRHVRGGSPRRWSSSAARRPATSPARSSRSTAACAWTEAEPLRPG